jgi:phage tail protein X
MVTELKFLTTEYLDAKEDKLLIPILSGHLPGEKILIRKMLWEIVRSIDYHQYVNNKKIFYFTKDGDFIGVNSFHDVYKDFLRKHQKSGKILKIVFKQDFSETTEKYIKRPTASSDIIDYPKHYKKTLSELNADKNTSTIIIGSDKYEKYLYETLVVEKIVELNPGILDNISDFKPGLQIVFPSPEIIESESFILDDKVARHLYENINYNRAFDTAFIEGIEQIQNRIDTEYK